MKETMIDEIAAAFQAGGAEQALDRLAERLKAEQRWHELFDTRLMQARLSNALPVAESASLEKLPEPLRGRIERAYIDACREVGWGLFTKGELREAWKFLRPTGEQAVLAEKLAKSPPDEARADQFIEVALHEGVAPELGFQRVLSQYGICNAISAMDTIVVQFPPLVRQAAAALLVRELYRDLLKSLREDVAGRGRDAPGDATLGQLLAANPGLCADGGYHVDNSHLASVVRSARIIEDPAVLQLAWELTEYGRGLHADYQLPDEEPFGEMYRATGLFFAAQLGRQVNEAVTYFRERAEAKPADADGSLAAEVYVALLLRLRRYREAIEALVRLCPAGTPRRGFAPSLFELCRAAGDFGAMLDECRQRGDAIGFAVAMVSASDRDGRVK